MTRQFNQQFHCPNCQTWHSAETLFGRWIRNNPSLDSGKGFSVSDQDYWVHRFKTFDNREFQLLMLVEIKTNGSSLSEAQKDTLHIANQLLRNRKNTPTKENKNQPVGYVNVRSLMNKRHVLVRSFGMHLLTFSGLGPDDSEWMAWNTHFIDEQQLTSLLRFDLDPDTLTPITEVLRRHHKTNNNQLLPLF